jgi:polysaccharide export outer membrane protein
MQFVRNFPALINLFITIFLCNISLNISSPAIARQLISQLPMINPTAEDSPLLSVPVEPDSIPSQPNIQPNINNQAQPDLTKYILGPGDRLQIDIFNVPEYSGENGRHQVQIDGSLNLAFIGKVKVSGFTLEEAKKVIEERYTEYLQIPLVTMNLIAARNLQIAIAGEVLKPGAYSLTPALTIGETGQTAQMPTITKALQLAGGTTASADIRQVKIRRSQPNGPEQIINVNLWELLQTGDLSQDVTLRDGDTLFIPTVTDYQATESQQLADANFAATPYQSLNIAVVGAVNRPGPYILGVDTPDPNNASSNNQKSLNTVTKAIRTAGGITPLADIRQISIKRFTRAGTEQIIAVDLWKLLQTGDLSQDVILQSGDTVLVPTAAEMDVNNMAEIANASFAPGSLKVSVIGEVISPGELTVIPNTTLNQAIVAAGGFNKKRAETELVELIRINPNGSVEKRKIMIDLAAEVNQQTNPILLNNDVILVGRSGRAAFSDNLSNILTPFSPLGNFFGIFRFLNIFD